MSQALSGTGDLSCETLVTGTELVDKNAMGPQNMDVDFDALIKVLVRTCMCTFDLFIIGSCIYGICGTMWNPSCLWVSSCLF